MGEGLDMVNRDTKTPPDEPGSGFLVGSIIIFVIATVITIMAVRNAMPINQHRALWSVWLFATLMMVAGSVMNIRATRERYSLIFLVLPLIGFIFLSNTAPLFGDVTVLADDEPADTELAAARESRLDARESPDESELRPGQIRPLDNPPQQRPRRTPTPRQECQPPNCEDVFLREVRASTMTFDGIPDSTAIEFGRSICSLLAIGSPEDAADTLMAMGPMSDASMTRAEALYISRVAGLFIC